MDRFFRGTIAPDARVILSTPDTDATVITDPTKNWVLDRNMSIKRDCGVAAATTVPATFSCAVLDAHFYRNWVTSSPD